MSEPVYICKHCGSDDIYAEVEASGTASGYVAVDGKGEPYFETDGRPDYHDFDETYYVCGGCRKGAGRLDKLVVERRAEDQLRRPCGRCDHDALEHPSLGHGSLKGYTRPPMPCTVAGCDCHDFYDVAIASPDVPPGQESLALEAP